MPRIKSSRYIENAQSLSAPETPLILVTVTHALLAEPLRFVNDNQDIVSNGNNYLAGSMSITLPDDQDGQTPAAQIEIGNVSRRLSPWFERTHGARGTLVTLTQILRSTPDFIEDEVTLDLRNVVVTPLKLSGHLGFDDILNKAGTSYTYRPETSPGLF